MRPHDPRRLDVERFAADRGRLQGQWPLMGMQRLVDACHGEARPLACDGVGWQAAGERRRRTGSAETHAWLRLTLEARVRLTCQRCLGPVETPLRVERWFQFVESEERAAQLDADSEDDVLVSTRSLDLQQLAEDELLLALPLVPRHEACPLPLRSAVSDAVEASDAAPNPFAALAALRRATH